MRVLFLTTVLLAIISTATFAARYREIDSRQAKPLFDKGAIYLLDVRTPDEFRQAHLKGAVLIPINQMEKRLGEIPRDRQILVYCAVGSRSNLVAGFLADKGYREVINMTDGIVGWYRNGFPIQR